MSAARLVLLIPVGDADLPGFGGGIPAFGGRPDQGLPGHGHPDHGLPGAPGHPANRPPNVPPNVTWPPQFPPHAGNTLPPEISGNRPTNPINLPEGSPLPPNSAFVAVYSEKGGWSFAVVQAAQPKA